MKKRDFLAFIARQPASATQVSWFNSTKRQFFWVPRQSYAAQTARPAGLFGVLVSPYS